MADRRRDRDPDPEEIHRRMLEHLEAHPPPHRPAEKSPERRPSSRTDPPTRPSDPPPRPRLMLRRLRVEEALRRLEAFLRFHVERGTPEVVVVVGRGQRSGETGPVLGPAVRDHCRKHPKWVRDLRVAPPSEGGEGALILVLPSGRE